MRKINNLVTRETNRKTSNLVTRETNNLSTYGLLNILQNHSKW